MGFSAGVTLTLLAVPLANAYERIAGYSPASLVTDYNAIDLDLAKIVYSLEKVTPSDLATAYAVYHQGGNSESVAKITLGDAAGIKRLDVVTGTGEVGSGASAGSSAVTGVVQSVSGNDIFVEYTTATQKQVNAHAGCRVGGLPAAEQITDYCFDISQDLTIGGKVHTATAIDNTQAGRTLKGFSAEAKIRFRSCSLGCPLWLFLEYANFYGVDDYGDKYVMAALGSPENGFKPGPVGFAKHDMDFSGAESRAQNELIEKGIMMFNVWMYVYRMLEMSVGQCKPDCIACNDPAVKAWDGAMAFYTGSLEGEMGSTDRGVLPHALADKRCHNFLTCGPNGGDPTGASMVNHKIFGYMQDGQSKLLMGDCKGARGLIKSIVAQMTIPFVQGTLRYAQIVSRTGSNAVPFPDKARAEGTSFASALVPRIAACPDGAEDAELIWKHMKHGSTTIDHPAIKLAVERHYGCLNITCEEVGGFWDHSSRGYNSGAEPCVTPTDPGGLSQTAITIIGVGGGALAVALLCALWCVCCLVKAEKKGAPIFTPLAAPPTRPGSPPA